MVRITDMPDVVIRNIDILTQKATFEQPSGWQFKSKVTKRPGI